ncbi:SRPBCC family protein [Nitratireductor soli]|uniref:SRPBCC family protein n=1 Tax=Nitratireductor soli TaxID=1670619 RepID=UPI00065E3F01|nr:SRPBCC domain-containing protein [Nitratireductor soli]
MTSTGRFELDKDGNRLILRRTVKTSAEKLFDAWTKPEQVSKWWDPSGHNLVACVIDLRVGGGFSFVNEGFEDHPFEGTYTEISRPQRIVFSAMGAEGSVLLEEDGATTHMIVEMKCGSREQLEQFVKMGIGDGTAKSLDNLVAFIRDGIL